MVWARSKLWLLWLGVLPGFTGCQNLFAPKGPPADPLVVLKKPLSARPEAGPPVHVAYSEPRLPADPLFQDNQPSFADAPPRRIPGVLTNRTIERSLPERLSPE